MDKKNNIHKYVNTFNPDISVMNTECRDYLFDFHAGMGNENFNDFLQKEADEYRTSGNGVTFGIQGIIFAFHFGSRTILSKKWLSRHDT